MSSIVAGVVAIALAVVLYTTIRRALAAKAQPAWASEKWTSFFHVPLIVVALAFGAAFLIEGIASVASGTAAAEQQAGNLPAR
jgi:hypothetical protein